MTIVYDTARLDLALAALSASPDADAAALGALELGALSEADTARAQAFTESLASHLRRILVDAIEQQHLRHRSSIERALERLALRGELLSTHPILTDDPEAAEQAQRRALSALSSREALHRLELSAVLLGEPPVEQLRRSRAALDESLRRQLCTWGSLAPWRARFVGDLRVGADRLADRWWVALWPEGPEDSEEPEQELAPIAAWIQGRISVGRLALTQDEATALLSTEQGRRLAEYLFDHLDLSALEAVPAVALKPTPSLFEQWRARLGGTLRELVDQLASVTMPQPEGELAFAATQGREPLATGFRAMARFFAEKAAFVDAVGVIGIGSLALGSTADAATQSAVLVVPARQVQAIALGDDPLVERPRWQNGLVVWAHEPADALTFHIVLDDGSEARVPVSTNHDSGDSTLAVILRAMATSSHDDLVALVDAAEAVGDEHTREAGALLRLTFTRS